MAPHGQIFVIKRTGEDGSCFPLLTKTCRIGRGHVCDIRIQRDGISEEHCLIEVGRDSQVWIRNFTESCRTLVSDIPLSTVAVALKHMDVIAIADRFFRWEYLPESRFYSDKSADEVAGTEENVHSACLGETFRFSLIPPTPERGESHLGCCKEDKSRSHFTSSEKVHDKPSMTFAVRRKSNTRLGNLNTSDRVSLSSQNVKLLEIPPTPSRGGLHSGDCLEEDNGGSSVSSSVRVNDKPLLSFGVQRKSSTRLVNLNESNTESLKSQDVNTREQNFVNESELAEKVSVRRETRSRNNTPCETWKEGKETTAENDVPVEVCAKVQVNSREGKMESSIHCNATVKNNDVPLESESLKPERKKSEPHISSKDTPEIDISNIVESSSLGRPQSEMSSFSKLDISDETTNTVTVANGGNWTITAEDESPRKKSLRSKNSFSSSLLEDQCTHSLENGVTLLSEWNKTPIPLADESSSVEHRKSCKARVSSANITTTPTVKKVRRSGRGVNTPSYIENRDVLKTPVSIGAGDVSHGESEKLISGNTSGPGKKTVTPLIRRSTRGSMYNIRTSSCGVNLVDQLKTPLTVDMRTFEATELTKSSLVNVTSRKKKQETPTTADITSISMGSLSGISVNDSSISGGEMSDSDNTSSFVVNDRRLSSAQSKKSKKSAMKNTLTSTPALSNLVKKSVNFSTPVCGKGIEELLQTPEDMELKDLYSLQTPDATNSDNLKLKHSTGSKESGRKSPNRKSYLRKENLSLSTTEISSACDDSDVDSSAYNSVLKNTNSIVNTPSVLVRDISQASIRSLRSCLSVASEVQILTPQVCKSFMINTDDKNSTGSHDINEDKNLDSVQDMGECERNLSLGENPVMPSVCSVTTVLAEESMLDKLNSPRSKIITVVNGGNWTVTAEDESPRKKSLRSKNSFSSSLLEDQCTHSLENGVTLLSEWNKTPIPLADESSSVEHRKSCKARVSSANITTTPTVKKVRRSGRGVNTPSYIENRDVLKTPVSIGAGDVSHGESEKLISGNTSGPGKKTVTPLIRRSTRGSMYNIRTSSCGVNLVDQLKTPLTVDMRTFEATELTKSSLVNVTSRKKKQETPTTADITSISMGSLSGISVNDSSISGGEMSDSDNTSSFVVNDRRLSSAQSKKSKKSAMKNTLTSTPALSNLVKKSVNFSTPVCGKGIEELLQTPEDMELKDLYSLQTPDATNSDNLKLKHNTGSRESGRESADNTICLLLEESSNASVNSGSSKRSSAKNLWISAESSNASTKRYELDNTPVYNENVREVLPTPAASDVNSFASVTENDMLTKNGVEPTEEYSSQKKKLVKQSASITVDHSSCLNDSKPLIQGRQQTPTSDNKVIFEQLQIQMSGGKGVKTSEKKRSLSTSKCDISSMCDRSVFDSTYNSALEDSSTVVSTSSMLMPEMSQGSVRSLRSHKMVNNKEQTQTPRAHASFEKNLVDKRTPDGNKVSSTCMEGEYVVANIDKSEEMTLQKAGSSHDRYYKVPYFEDVADEGNKSALKTSTIASLEDCTENNHTVPRKVACGVPIGSGNSTGRDKETSVCGPFTITQLSNNNKAVKENGSSPASSTCADSIGMVMMSPQIKSKIELQYIGSSSEDMASLNEGAKSPLIEVGDTPSNKGYYAKSVRSTRSKSTRDLMNSPMSLEYFDSIYTMMKTPLMVKKENMKELNSTSSMEKIMSSGENTRSPLGEEDDFQMRNIHSVKSVRLTRSKCRTSGIESIPKSPDYSGSIQTMMRTPHMVKKAKMEELTTESSEEEMISPGENDQSPLLEEGDSQTSKYHSAKSVRSTRSKCVIRETESPPVSTNGSDSTYTMIRTPLMVKNESVEEIESASSEVDVIPPDDCTNSHLIEDGDSQINQDHSAKSVRSAGSKRSSNGIEGSPMSPDYCDSLRTMMKTSLMINNEGMKELRAGSSEEELTSPGDNTRTPLGEEGDSKMSKVHSVKSVRSAGSKRSSSGIEGSPMSPDYCDSLCTMMKTPLMINNEGMKELRAGSSEEEMTSPGDNTRTPLVEEGDSQMSKVHSVKSMRSTRIKRSTSGIESTPISPDFSNSIRTMMRTPLMIDKEVMEKLRAASSEEEIISPGENTQSPFLEEDDSQNNRYHSAKSVRLTRSKCRTSGIESIPKSPDYSGSIQTMMRTPHMVMKAKMEELTSESGEEEMISPGENAQSPLLEEGDSQTNRYHSAKSVRSTRGKCFTRETESPPVSNDDSDSMYAMMRTPVMAKNEGVKEIKSASGEVDVIPPDDCTNSHLIEDGDSQINQDHSAKIVRSAGSKRSSNGIEGSPMSPDYCDSLCTMMKTPLMINNEGMKELRAGSSEEEMTSPGDDTRTPLGEEGDSQMSKVHSVKSVRSTRSKCRTSGIESTPMSPDFCGSIYTVMRTPEMVKEENMNELTTASCEEGKSVPSMNTLASEKGGQRSKSLVNESFEVTPLSLAALGNDSNSLLPEFPDSASKKTSEGSDQKVSTSEDCATDSSTLLSENSQNICLPCSDHVKWVKKWLSQKSPKSRYSDFQGMKRLFQGKSPESGYDNVSGVKEIFATPETSVAQENSCITSKNCGKTRTGKISKVEVVESTNEVTLGKSRKESNFKKIPVVLLSRLSPQVMDKAIEKATTTEKLCHSKEGTNEGSRNIDISKCDENVKENVVPDMKAKNVRSLTKSSVVLRKSLVFADPENQVPPQVSQRITRRNKELEVKSICSQSSSELNILNTVNANSKSTTRSRTSRKAVTKDHVHVEDLNENIKLASISTVNNELVLKPNLRNVRSQRKLKKHVQFNVSEDMTLNQESASAIEDSHPSGKEPLISKPKSDKVINEERLTRNGRKMAMINKADSVGDAEATTRSSSRRLRAVTKVDEKINGDACDTDVRDNPVGPQTIVKVSERTNSGKEAIVRSGRSTRRTRSAIVDEVLSTSDDVGEIHGNLRSRPKKETVLITDDRESKDVESVTQERRSKRTRAVEKLREDGNGSAGINSVRVNRRAGSSKSEVKGTAGVESKGVEVSSFEKPSTKETASIPGDVSDMGDSKNIRPHPNKSKSKRKAIEEIEDLLPKKRVLRKAVAGNEHEGEKENKEKPVTTSRRSTRRGKVIAILHETVNSEIDSVQEEKGQLVNGSENLGNNKRKNDRKKEITDGTNTITQPKRRRATNDEKVEHRPVVTQGSSSEEIKSLRKLPRRMKGNKEEEDNSGISATERNSGHKKQESRNKGSTDLALEIHEPNVAKVENVRKSSKKVISSTKQEDGGKVPVRRQLRNKGNISSVVAEVNEPERPTRRRIMTHAVESGKPLITEEKLSAFSKGCKREASETSMPEKAKKVSKTGSINKELQKTTSGRVLRRK